MDQLKAAVKKLLISGKIILPDALQVLQSVSEPMQVVNNLLEKNPDIQEIDAAILKAHTSEDLQTTSSHPKATPRGPSIPPTRLNRLTSRMLDNIQLHTPTSQEFSNDKPLSEKSTTSSSLIRTELDDLHGLNNYEPSLEIVYEPQFSKHLTGGIEDLVGYFQNRFQKLSLMLRSRYDLKDIIKMKYLKESHLEVSVIGMITEKHFQHEKSGKLILEDPSSDHQLDVVINNNKLLVEKALQLMNDTVIAVTGFVKHHTLFAKDFILPDIPRGREIKYADVPVHVAFLSDIHVGSKNFIEPALERFVEFLNGNYGSSKLQKIGLQTKYVLFSGDVIDGVGIYPNHQQDLAIESVKEQYDTFARYLERIPEDVQMVVIPGNHDMVRSAEPQPKIPAEYAPALDSFSNVHLLPNPSTVSLHGVSTLLYHCTSLPDIMNHIPGTSINKPVDVMKHMLKARHLSPLWGDRTPLAAEPEDHLVIDPIPDIFHGGHIHINGEGSYRRVQIINSGTMQKQTTYQKSLNIIPTPGQISIMNLKDRSLSKLDVLANR